MIVGLFLAIAAAVRPRDEQQDHTLLRRAFTDADERARRELVDRLMPVVRARVRRAPLARLENRGDPGGVRDSPGMEANRVE